MGEEILAKGVIKNKDPNALYYVNNEGDICKRDKRGLSHKKRRQKLFTEMDLTIPKVLLKSYISMKMKTIRRIGRTGAYVSMPNNLIGKSGRIIFIPKDEVDNLFEESDSSVNVF